MISGRQHLPKGLNAVEQPRRFRRADEDAAGLEGSSYPSSPSLGSAPAVVSRIAPLGVDRVRSGCTSRPTPVAGARRFER